jgi:hypothetical protein
MLKHFTKLLAFEVEKVCVCACVCVCVGGTSNSGSSCSQPRPCTLYIGVYELRAFFLNLKLCVCKSYLRLILHKGTFVTLSIMLKPNITVVTDQCSVSLAAVQLFLSNSF